MSTYLTPLYCSRRQGGYATLAIGVVMLFMVSLITIYATRSGILDLRTAANRIRATEAQSVAEGRVDAGMAWLEANRGKLTPASWPQCAASNANLPCGDGNTNKYDNTWRYQCFSSTSATNPVDCSTGSPDFYLVTKPDATGGYFIFGVVAQGQSADGTASGVVKQAAYLYQLFSSGSMPAPFMAAGNIHLNGSYNIVANPNGAASGVPVSAWTPNTVDMGTGTPKTCQLYEYLNNTPNPACPNDSTQLSGSTNGKKADIVENSPTPPFPADMFEYVFGKPTSAYADVKATATNYTDCTNITSASSGLYWVTGDCTIPADAGTAANPLILVVQPGGGLPGNFQLNANRTFYGIIFMFDPSTPHNPGDLALNGGAKVWGTILTNDNTSAGQTINGTFDLIYSSDIMLKVSNDKSLRGFSKVPGSWVDFLCNSGSC